MTKTADTALIVKKFQENGPHIFFFDIDGTIISALSTNGVSKRFAEAVKKGHEKGHLFFINTGRAYGYIPRSVLCSADFDGVVSGLGAHVIYKDKVIYHDFLSKKSIRSICEYCEEHNESIIFECEHNDEHGGRYTLGNSEFFDVRRDFDKKEDLYTSMEGINVIKITVPYVPCDEYAAFLEREFDMSYVKPIYAEGAYIGNNKGTAIRRVCDILGFPYENTVAVGDSDNDTKMLEYANISVAMGNAPDHIKDQAVLVCDSLENDGAAKLVEMLIGCDDE